MGLFLMFFENDGAEIHYGLGPTFWGNGLATEAGLAVMAWVRGEPNLSLVHTICATAHDESRRVLEKIGFVCERPVPEALMMKANGEKLDGMFYAWRRSE
jgi:[ribosomal protein S5]-alanine N-acetyltransferase